MTVPLCLLSRQGPVEHPYLVNCRRIYLQIVREGGKEAYCICDHDCKYCRVLSASSINTLVDELHHTWLLSVEGVEFGDQPGGDGHLQEEYNCM